MSETTSVGISLGREQVRIVQLRREGRVQQVEKVLEISARQPVQLSFLLDESARREWHEKLVQKLNGVLPANVPAVVAIPTGLCHIRVMTVDADLNDQELSQQAEWELEHSVLSPATDYGFGVERLAGSVGMTDAAVLVAVRKDTVSALRQLLTGFGPRLVSMEAGVFAAQRAFLHNYEVDDLRPTLLLGWQDHSLNGMFLKGQSYFQFFSLILPEKGGGADPSSTAEHVRDAVDKVAKYHDVVSTLEELSAVYLYGDIPSEDLVDALRDTSEARVERLNPFHRVRLVSEAAEDVVVEARPESFAASVGAALW